MVGILMKVSLGKFPKKINGERKVSVKIDPWDTWSMDHTLSLIIHPMLIQLKNTKHGSPFTDDNDVPEELRSTSAPPKENEWDTDDNHFKRWEWILDEMIWAFAQQLDDDASSQFHSGKIDLQFKEVEVDGEKYNEMVRGPLDTHVFDKEGHDAWQARKSNGFKLFGKYYEALWD
jgi:hypothetical protein